MDKSTLQIDIEVSENSTVITPLGDIDLSKSSDLRVALRPIIDAKTERIVVDLSHVPYMDSSGIATLIEGLQLSKKSNICFVLCSLQEGVRSIIELARLDQIFTIFDTREDSLAH
ncbi:MAG: STAS domain-containing protein [Phycisphaerales bacterium]|nr:STAS domain-containing protein [Planctomycetota bacterium]MBL6997986.1 STAS domain-containing protein [Phycisphaerales bacterium]